jgi:ParB family chromosome partitioning protein
MSKPALGRGLGALLGGGVKPAAPSSVPASGAPGAPAIPVLAAPTVPAVPPPLGSVVRRVSRDRVRPSPLQPRKDFTAEALSDLADSIREQGIIQPLVVRPVGDYFELIAGERRWRAAEMAGLTEVPVIERNATDIEVLELALIENLQRENLNPVEEALGYRQLQAQFALTQDEISRKVGRGRVVVANALRLLKLPESVLGWLRQGSLSVGHAKAVLAVESPTRQEALARRAIDLGLTVRQLESEAGAAVPPPSGTKPTSPITGPARDPHQADLENRIRERFGMKVALRYKAGKGSLEVRFHSDDELDRVLQVIGVSVD